MTRPRSTNRFSLALSLCLLCLTASSAFAEVPLRAFTASYDLNKGSMHFAIAELSLAPFDDHWRWSLTTRARGIYAVFYSKEPYSETVFSFDRQSMRLHKILITDEREAEENADEYESASFDWVNRKMKVLRKGKRKQVELSAGVYDYQSIHLLAATMQRQRLEKATVNFYRKGNLADTRLIYQGEATVEVGDKSVDARVFTQTITGSRTKTTYYYDAQNPMLPLLIETRKDDDSPTILRLREVEWQS